MSGACCIRKDMAFLAVSFFILILVSICLNVLGLSGLLVLLVLAWGLVKRVSLNPEHAKSSGEMAIPEMTCGSV